MLVCSIKFDDCTMWKVLFLSVFAFLHTISFLRWLIVVFSLLFYFVLVYIFNETQTLISVDDIKMYDDDEDACMWACNSCANFITIESIVRAVFDVVQNYCVWKCSLHFVFAYLSRYLLNPFPYPYPFPFDRRKCTAANS